jgi:hypothetical protein
MVHVRSILAGARGVTVGRSQAAAPWVPSRHRFALFRAVAFVRLLTSGGAIAEPRHENRIVLAVDRDQSTAENYTVAIFVFLTVTSFLAAALSARLVPAAALLLAPMFAAVILSGAVVFTGLVLTPLAHALGLPRGANNLAANSAWIFIGIALAASYFATSTTWVRVPAWTFLAAIALNGICSGILFVLRGRIRAAELRCAG